MSYIEEELTFYEFAQRFLDLKDMETPVNLDISALNIEIESLLPNGKIDFMPMTSFIVKEKVNSHYKLGNLKGTSQHKVLFNNEYIKLSDHPDAIKIDEEMLVVDTSVEETQNYIANGQVNHNTTPGGVAIPFHSSVRIKLGAGAPIEGPDKEMIGINVSAKIIKNKVAYPFRKADFQIIFGRGIREHEEIFDTLRKHGTVEYEGKNISIEGNGAWKSLLVVNSKGVVEIEKKFYKADFQEIMNDPQYKEYIDILIEKAYTKTGDITIEDMDIDPDSYVENEAVAQQIVESEYSNEDF